METLFHLWFCFLFRVSSHSSYLLWESLSSLYDVGNLWQGFGRCSKCHQNWWEFPQGLLISLICLGSRVLKASADCQLSIDVLDWYPQSIPLINTINRYTRSILDWHSVDTSVDTCSTLDWHLGQQAVDSQLRCWWMHKSQPTLSWLSADYWSSVLWVSIKYWSRCWWSTDWDVDRGYWMPLVQMILHLFPACFTPLPLNIYMYLEFTTPRDTALQLLQFILSTDMWDVNNIYCFKPLGLK